MFEKREDEVISREKSRRLFGNVKICGSKDIYSSFLDTLKGGYINMGAI